MRKAEFIAGIVLLVFGLTLIFWIIPVQSVRVDFASIQPAVYPLIAAWAMVGFSALLIVSRWLLLSKSGDLEAAPLSLRSWMHLGFVTAILLAGLFAFDYLGFIAGGIGLVAVLMLYMGARHPAMIGGVTVGVTMAIWLFFDQLLGRPLP